MPSVQCPRCGVYHPESAQRCDCGYDFTSGEVKASDLLTEADRQSSKLKRRSISRMLLLTVVTGGFYYPFWFLLRQHDINSLNAKEKLQSFPFVVAIVLVAVSVGFSVWASNVEAAAEMYEGAARLADLAAYILLLVQSFKVRRIFEAHLHADLGQLSDTPHLRHSQSSLSGVAVFFLQIFYLQYVINRRLAPAA